MINLIKNFERHNVFYEIIWTRYLVKCRSQDTIDESNYLL